jgi:MFS family permease
MLAVKQNVIWQLGVVLISSGLLSVTYPLTDAVYTDILVRMGHERKHLIGLTDSALNLAYIGGPILAGFMAQVAGEQKTFAITGGVMALIGLTLLLVMPKKIRLPQHQIAQWSD